MQSAKVNEITSDKNIIGKVDTVKKSVIFICRIIGMNCLKFEH